MLKFWRVTDADKAMNLYLESISPENHMEIIPKERIITLFV